MCDILFGRLLLAKQTEFTKHRKVQRVVPVRAELSSPSFSQNFLTQAPGLIRSLVIESVEKPVTWRKTPLYLMYKITSFPTLFLVSSDP
jgi:hypothetical protein